MGENNDLNPPENDLSDIGYAAIRAALSMIPIGGGAAVELLQFVFQPPIEKRRNEWEKTLVEVIYELQKNKGIKIEDLQTNDIFIDTVIQATHIAYRNSQVEKREALKNAIAHSGLPDPPEQSLQQMFLNWLDIFTVWHLRILMLFQNPEKWGKDNRHQFPRMTSGGADDILENAFPEMQKQRDFYDQVWNDLYQKGLVGNNNLHVMMTGRGMLEKRITDLGDKFLAFIEKNEEK
jgi:hypothetical protein